MQMTPKYFGKWRKPFCLHKVAFSPLMSSVTFLYPLKTSEKRMFSDVFGRYKNVTLDINGLKNKTY